MKKQYQYLIGVDGGGTGTRVVLENLAGLELGRGSAGPSGLMHGSESAWKAILSAVEQAFSEAAVTLPELSEIALGCGLAGVHNKVWAAEFAAKNPGFSALVVETDAASTLYGAHLGQPGVVIALGTGSVGEVMLADGTRREVGGWGFPSSDEASGAWLGLHAINHVQHVLDGRSETDALAESVIAYCISCGAEPAPARDAVFNWLAQANQTRFAQLAPLVIEHAGRIAKADEIMLKAGLEVAKMARALDATGLMPVALCGGLAEPMMNFLPEELRAKAIKPQADSATGALILLKKFLQNSVSES